MFTLLLSVVEDPAGDGYQVALFQEDSDGGWPAAPLAACAIPAGLDPAGIPTEVGPGPAIERISAYVQANTQSDVFGRIGEYLAGLLLTGDVAARWDKIRQDHSDGVRTLLRIDPPELRLLPWELMGRNGDRLFVDPASQFARVQRLDNDDAGRLGHESLPLRVLVVDGESDSSLGTVDEVRAIKRALARFGGRVEAEFLTEPSETALRAAYERLRPHVFHFVGHGARVPKTKEAALRVYDRSAGKAWLLTSEYVRNLLRPAPRLTVMNACRSGQVTDVGSLTEAFVAGGGAAVIGMQGDVRGEAAAMFGGGLYEALADGLRLDEAVTRARRDVYAATGVARSGRDWFLPSLTLRVRPEHVLPMTSALSLPQWRQVENRLQSQNGFRVFVDRTDQRHRLARWIDSDANSGTYPRLLVLEGQSQTGKSSLLHWIRRRCALHGQSVRYVNFDGDGNLDLVGALCAIRDTDEDPPARGGAANAFDRFNYDLPYLAAGRLPREPRPGPLPHVESAPVPESLRPGPVVLVDRMLESFRDALGAATAQDPLILILDHLDGLLKPMFQQELYPGLIRRIAEEDGLAGLRLVVALTNDSQDSYWPSDERNAGEWIKVELCQPNQWVPLAEDFVLALGKEFEEKDAQLIKLMAVAPNVAADAPWKLVKLELVRQLFG
jgi:CHAT domain-containing protein/AAA ATPase-like protein